MLLLPEDNSVISFSLKFSRFKFNKQNIASGTFDNSFCAKSKPVKFVTFSIADGKLFKFLWVFLICNVSKFNKDGNCLN